MVAPNSVSLSTRTGFPAPTGATRHAASRQEAVVDAALVRRFNAGDQTAFAEIDTRHRGRLFAIAFRQLRNAADAEEIAQDALVRAYRGLAHFRGESSLSVWLHSITLNLARNRYWHSFRRQRHVTQSLDRPISDDNPANYAECVACDAPGPQREAVTAEFNEFVAACLVSLNSAQREILKLSNGRELSYQEIAKALGINIGTVKSRIWRARENLRVMLTETYGDADLGSTSFSQWFEPNRPYSSFRLARSGAGSS